MVCIIPIRELNDDQNAPSIMDLIHQPIKEKEVIINYMKNCRIDAVAPAIIHDVINPKNIISDLLLMSDNTYEWRSDIIYYIEKYDLTLPEVFIRHVLHQINIAKEIKTAIKQGDLEKIKLIISKNKEAIFIITPFGSWLHLAASMGKTDVLKFLVESGLDPNIEAGTFHAGAINRAASKGHYDIVEYLLTRGAKIDVSEPDKNPLFAAIYGGHKNIVQLLLDNGIDASVKYAGDYMNQMNAYDFAIERGETEIAVLLEQYREGNKKFKKQG